MSCSGVVLQESRQAGLPGYVFCFLGIFLIVKNIETHNQKLKKIFIEHILAKGYESILNEKSASIVPFRSPNKDPGILLKKLEKKKVRLALRNGYIRAAFHFINHLQEVKTLIDLL